jgi:threonine dehydrogenase-like Zn-dependent dehydrogenase
MRALVFHQIGDIRLDDVPMPKLKNDYDAIINVTTSAICGTDLHFVRGTVGPMKRGTILGHEAVGVVEKVGKKVANFREGDRVIIPSTVACGYCEMCRKGFYAQCNVANTNGPEAGTAFFGGPEDSGPLDGCQAEYVRVPYANNNLVKLPDDVSDDKAILLSDIFPTAYFGADIAKVKIGNVVVVMGCGPVGQFVITSCKLMGASRIFAIDRIPSRLELARSQGAECINFDEVDPIEFVKEATGGTMADVVIDAVGVDAICPAHGPAGRKAAKNKKEFQKEVAKIAPNEHPDGKNWVPGNAPSQTLRAGVELVAKCGTISIIGVYPQTSEIYPIGKAMNKNLNIVMGNCHHRSYIPDLLNKVQAGIVDPTRILTQKESFANIIDAYKHFDLRQEGWIKVALKV